MQQALIGKYKGKEPILLVNIGGGSTELVVMKGRKVMEAKNIDLGVSSILSEFITINNNRKSGTSLGEIKSFVDTKLPDLKNTVHVAFYSGGELTYMKLAGY